MRVRFGASAAAVAVGLTVLALVLPAVSTTDISARLFPNGLSLGSSGKGAGDAGPGVGTAIIGFNTSVVLGGRLVSQPRIVLNYAAGSAPGHYEWTSVQYPAGQLPRDTNPHDGGIGSNMQRVNASIVMQPGATGPQPLVPFTGSRLL